MSAAKADAPPPDRESGTRLSPSKPLPRASLWPEEIAELVFVFQEYEAAVGIRSSFGSMCARLARGGHDVARRVPRARARAL